MGGDEPGTNPAAEPSPSAATGGPTAETPAPIATAVAQAATVRAAYATPETETDYCGRLCQPSFWQDASVADLDGEISAGASVNAKFDARGEYNEGRRPLHFAVVDADIPVIEALLDRGADLEAVDAAGLTALHVVVGLSHNPELKRPDVVALLLGRGANANAQTTQGGDVPLHFANDTLVAALLLNYGADVNQKNEHGKTLLHSASFGTDVALVALLLEHGADVNAVANNGYTPLLNALGSGEAAIVRLLLEHGADANAVADDGYTPLMAVFSRAGDDATDIAVLLLKSGAEVNAVSDVGATPLSYAMEYASIHGEADAIALLLEHGADANAVDEYGLAPLGRAVSYADVDVDAVALLVAHGADIDAKDDDVGTACQYVEEGLGYWQLEQSEIDAIRALVCP